MLLVVGVICIVSVFVYNAIKGNLQYWESSEFVMVLVASLALGVIADFWVAVDTYDTYIEKEVVTEVVESREIVALEDVNTEEGRFFLGCGSIGSESYYAYYYKGEHGTTLDKVKLYDESCPVYINEISGKEKPRIEEYRTTQKNILVKKPGYKSLILFRILSEYKVGDDVGDHIWESGLSTSDKEDRYEIYVPKYTIKEDYNVDLK